MSIYYKMNWYMQWRLAESKVLTCQVPRGTGSCNLMALSYSGHCAQLKGLDGPMPSHAPSPGAATSKVDAGGQSLAALPPLGIILKGQSSFTAPSAISWGRCWDCITVDFFLRLVPPPSLPCKHCSWESSQASHVQILVSGPVFQAM